MNFFEYLFCRLYWWNTQIIKEKVTPTSYSISGLALFHTLTIIPIYSVFYVLLLKSFYIKDILGINPFLIIAIIVFILNYFYFRKPRYTILLKKFNQIPKEQKKKKDILCIVYIATIIVVNVLFFIYFRSKNLSA
jgi:hypothetical protein